MIAWLRSVGLRLVLALGLGFALWIFVSYTENPDRRASFDSVPVRIEGLTPGLVVVDENGLERTTLGSVRVTVEAAAETLENLQPSDLRAFVDLSGRGAGGHVVPVKVEANRPDLSQLSFSVAPEFLQIQLEELITRTVPLTVEVTGNVPFSFEAGEPRVTTDGQPVTQARVMGPGSRVARVDHVRATADIDRLTANYDSRRPLEPVADDGQVVAGVTVEPEMVNVLVPITSSAGIKRVPVVPRLAGEPASGYVVTGLSVEPQFVRLTGSTGPLESVQSIATQAVDVSGASATFSRTVALQEPAGTRLLAGEPVSATVTVRVAPIERPFRVTLPAPVQITDIGAGLLASVNPPIVQVTLTGSAAQLAALDAATLQATVSVRGLSAGTYTLAPTFALPAGISLAGEPPKVTVTLRPLPSPTPTATPPPTATPQSTETPASAQPTGTPPPAPVETPTAAPAEVAPPGP